MGRGGGGSPQQTKNGVGVWPNTFMWTWDEQVKSSLTTGGLPVIEMTNFQRNISLN